MAVSTELVPLDAHLALVELLRETQAAYHQAGDDLRRADLLRQHEEHRRELAEAEAAAAAAQLEAERQRREEAECRVRTRTARRSEGRHLRSRRPHSAGGIGDSRFPAQFRQEAGDALTRS